MKEKKTLRTTQPSGAPWKLPKGWDWVPLGTITDVIMGQSPPGKSYNSKGKGLPFFQGKAEFGDLLPTPVKWCTEPKKISRPGDVLISVRAPVGPTNMTKEESCIGRGLAAIRPRNGLNTKYLLYALRALENSLTRQSTGSTFGAIGKKLLSDFAIPVPRLIQSSESLQMQRRIVARIEELMTEVKKARQLIAQIRFDCARVMEAILSEISPREGETLPEGWQWLDLNKKILEAKSGFACARKYAVDSGVLHIRPFNISLNGRINIAEHIDIPKNCRKDIKDFYLKPGDILFNNTNSVELVGKSALVRESIKCAFSNHITRLRIITKDLIDPAWLVLSLRFLWMQGYFARKCNKWIGQAGFNANRLREIKIPAPDIPTQRNIVAFYDSISSELKTIEKSIENNTQLLGQLEQSILEQAFRGEL